MKKTAALVAFVALAAGATLSYAGMPARTGVNGSFHDMNWYAPTKSGNVDQYNRVCVFCHTPHNATVIEPGNPLNMLPLWGSALTAVTPAAYQWATPANLVATIDDPLVGPSRLCMSCHDGTLAVDAHVSNGTANNGTLKLTGSRAIGEGGTLATTHPIGFDYDAAATARNLAETAVGVGNAVKEIVPSTEMFATAVTASNTQGTYNSVIRNSNRTIKSTLYNGTMMTCATCHEVHNKENAKQDAGTNGTPNYFLYAKESESLICLSCHIK